MVIGPDVFTFSEKKIVQNKTMFYIFSVRNSDSWMFWIFDKLVYILQNVLRLQISWEGTHVHLTNF